MTDAPPPREAILEPDLPIVDPHQHAHLDVVEVVAGNILASSAAVVILLPGTGETSSREHRASRDVR